MRRVVTALLAAALLLAACQGGMVEELTSPEPTPSVDVVLPEPSPTEGASPKPSTDEEITTQEHQDFPVTFTTTMRIHDDMPEFTFHRIVGDLLLEPCDEIPFPREVNILITDEEGSIIQSISGLTQSHPYMDRDIEFADFNFDGYLDMRLQRWQHGAGGRLSIEYFWLWDAEKSQFIMNEQLVEIDASGLFADQDTRQINVWNRDGSFGETTFYEYVNEDFILVAHQLHTFWHDSDTGQEYIELIRTDLLTGEITTETTLAP
jgi:hypothetical protein